MPASWWNTKKGKERANEKIESEKSFRAIIRDFENDVLRFLENKIVPFTNNLGENDIRMTKVQQKISGCFRSMDGAKIFCRVRSYLSTCRKHDVNTSKALDLLFQRKLPDFVNWNYCWLKIRWIITKNVFDNKKRLKNRN